MGLGGYKKADVPGSYKGPAKCRHTFEGERCDAPAHHTISTSVEVYGKTIPVKFPVCDKHTEGLIQDAAGNPS